MEKLFIGYEEALVLKELGFDEPCFRYWNDYGKTSINRFQLLDKIDEWCQDYVEAPLYQQAFKWFREKYELDCSFEDDLVEDENGEEVEMWDFFIYKTRQKVDNKVMEFCSNNFNTYTECFSKEEAEFECLKKLIQIVKNK
jgi:hypothetical protein